MQNEKQLTGNKMDNGHPEEDEVKSLVVSMLRQLTQKWRM
jgi:hypothetical protein